ncbi:hypothetical protein DAMA08_043990 [Martiniozyma asiatica (nom. inval.)]|nr:hypothetical protein DAMA08_043990 [Martiniozyma asiatica]
MSEAKIRKPRNRTPTSCEQCRKRKLKCDRGKPCSNCVKRNTEDMCRYVIGEPNYSLKVNLSNEIIMLKLKINKLENILRENNIDISRYNNMEMMTPDSCSQEKDPVISLTKKFDAMVVKENKVIHSGSTTPLVFVYGDKELEGIFRTYHQKHMDKYLEYLSKQNLKFSDVKNKNNYDAENSIFTSVDKDPCTVDSLEASQINEVLKSTQTEKIFKMIEKINKLLPSYHVLLAFVDNFFKNVYPIFPFIEEEVFREQLSLILVSYEDGGCEIGITHFQNISIVSILLIVLRFSYITTKHQHYFNIDKLDNSLAIIINSNVTIESDFMLYAKSLLHTLPENDNIFKNVTLRNIQVLLYLRLYQTYSPELSDESCENSLNLAIIIQMVRTIGANIDIDHLPLLNNDLREAIVWRRIFYKLLSLDLYSAFNYGTPMIIHDSEWTVKLPHLSKEEEEAMHEFQNGNTNNKSLEDIKRIVLENSINNDIKLEFEFYKIGREALEMFQNYQTGSKKSKLVGVVKKLEDFTNKNVPCLYEMINQPNLFRSNLERVVETSLFKKFEIRIIAITFIFTFYYLLYLSDDFETYVIDKLNCSFALKATENAMVIFKVAIDSAKFINYSSHNNKPAYQKFNQFFKNSISFIFSPISLCFKRVSLWIFSIFFKNIKDNSLTVDHLVKNFSGSVDASTVLKWINIDIKIPNETDDKQNLLIFFFLYNSLKDEYFVAWRNKIMIQMFLNYFKQQNTERFSVFLNTSIKPTNEMEILDIQPKFQLESIFTSNESPKSTELFASQFDDFFDSLNQDFPNEVNENDENLKQLFYEDFDSLINEHITNIYKNNISKARLDLFSSFPFPVESQQKLIGEEKKGNSNVNKMFYNLNTQLDPALSNNTNLKGEIQEDFLELPPEVSNLNEIFLDFLPDVKLT